MQKESLFFYKEKDMKKFLGEVLLNQDGKCLQKHFSQHFITYHTYNDDGNLVENVSFRHDSTSFRHIKYKYNNNGDLIERIQNDKSGAIIERDIDSLMLLMISIPVGFPIPRYVNNAQKGMGYTYNSAGLLVQYFSKGFYVRSSKSREDENYQGNELEYRIEYNKDNQIIKYYKRLKTQSSVCEIITKFRYVSDRIIRAKSHSSIGCRCFGCHNKLLYKIEYY